MRFYPVIVVFVVLLLSISGFVTADPNPNQLGLYLDANASVGDLEGPLRVTSMPAFTEITTPLIDVQYSGMAWGDYDSDGYLDLLVVGDSEFGIFSVVYHSDSGTLEADGVELTGVYNDEGCNPAAWGDYDNDGDLDILLTGNTGTSYVSIVYRNDAGTFVDALAGLPGVSYSSVAWGDYDNDGDLDILLTGWTGSAEMSEVYRNDGGDVFSPIGAGLPGVNRSSVAWGDYDNDGDLDILLTGWTGSTNVSDVYSNEGGGVFSPISAGLTPVNRSSVAWGDYDNDGDLDILLTGWTGSAAIAEVYENNAGSFSPLGAGLTGVYHGSASWGDCDNDGDLDALLTGWTGSAAIADVYENNSGSFSPVGAGLTEVDYSSAAWGDFDRDGDLDIALSGWTGSERVACVYENDSSVANTPPSAPENLVSAFSGNQFTMSWDAAMDAETPSAGLTYNLRVGLTPQGSEIMSAMVDSTSGHRMVVQAGNAQQRTSWTVTVPMTTIYWSVQSVDGAFAGSGFAAGSSCLVTDFIVGIWEEFEGVCNSTADWGDLNSDGYQDLLITGAINGIQRSRVYRNRVSEEHWVIVAELHPVSFGSADLGDCDGDGDPDILLTGLDGLPPNGISLIYRNDYPDFVEIGASLPGVVYGSVAWGDYDNDGDPDILLTGNNDGNYISKIYRNDYPDFIEDTDVVLPGIAHGSVAWGDYDNDGDMDILLTGNDGAGGISRVYRNVGGIFEEDDTAGLLGVDRSSAAWGDYDNDGDLDILLTGDTGGGYISKIYQNDNPGFTDVGASLQGVREGSVAWGDCDNDGDLDILLTGDTGGGLISKIYRNDNPNFTDVGGDIPGVCRGEAAWGDINMDRDLDFVLTGDPGYIVGLAQICNVRENYLSSLNHPPMPAPANLSASTEGSQITFTWDQGADVETPTAGLTYNLRVGSTPGGSDIFSPLAYPSGWRIIPALGNTNHNTSWTISAPDPAPSVYYWSVQSIDTGFAGGLFAAEEAYSPLSGILGDLVPRAFALEHSAPNPFNPQTTIAFELPRQEAVALHVFDVAGRLVKTLIEGEVYDQGRHEAVWRGRDDAGRQMSSGTYFYRLEAGEFMETKRMALIK